MRESERDQEEQRRILHQDQEQKRILHRYLYIVYIDTIRKKKKLCTLIASNKLTITLFSCKIKRFEELLLWNLL